MITVPSVIAEIVRRTPHLEEGIARGIINLSALARELQQEVEEETMKEVQPESIMMALKRLLPKLKPSKRHDALFEGNPELIVRSNLFEMTVQNAQSQIENQRKLLTYASAHHEQFSTITHGVFETTIIASHEARQFIQNLYNSATIISEFSDLSSITVKFPVDIVDTPGVYYSILKALAWEHIPLTEVVSTYSEFTVIIKEEYVDRAFSLIKKLF
ncbi:hypothetical protein KBD81_00805 [Candidatus Woesebacteria bacterium]|nr:hypothetical protein [Candidatus Woesebacteria bacterium]